MTTMSSAPDDVAFPTLTDDQLRTLAGYGSEVAVAEGEALFVEGQLQYDFIVVLDGEVDIIRHDPATGDETVIATHGAGRFLGELSLLTGQRTFLRGRATRAGRVLRIEPASFRRMLAAETDIGDLVFAAFVARREVLLTGAATTLRIIGSRYSRTALEIRSYVRRQRLAHTWIDLDGDDVGDVEVFLAELGVRVGDTPVVITPTAVLRSPTVGEVAEHLGLVYQPTSQKIHDVVIVGAGPAGLAAAVYGASEGLDTLLVDRVGVGGQAGTSSRIENYVGFPSGISGGELVERAALQAQRLGAQITSPCSVVGIDAICDGYRVLLADGAGPADGVGIVARTVVVALGVQYRKLPLDDLERFEGAGVYYAATDLEARVCAPGPVTVIGGGNSAGQAAVFLAQQGSQVTIAIRGDDLTSSMSSYLIDRIEASPAITVAAHTEVVGLHGDAHLEAITVRDNRTGETREVACDGLFSFIGAVPFTDWLAGFVELDDKGFIVTDTGLGDDLPFDPLPFETSRPGVFAAGDVRAGSMKRVAAAVGDGSSAIRSVHQRIAADAPV
jgi:thioredoxin reductase (NADPH)